MRHEDREIRHSGVVSEVTPNEVKVKIVPMSACSMCHARTVCGTSSGGSRIIPVRRRDDGSFRPGDQVFVTVRQSQGFKAVLFAYLIPLSILLVLLLTLSLLFENELAAGLGSIGFVALYYLVLALFRNKLDSGFIFTVEKIN